MFSQLQTLQGNRAGDHDQLINGRNLIDFTKKYISSNGSLLKDALGLVLKNAPLVNQSNAKQNKKSASTNQKQNSYQLGLSHSLFPPFYRHRLRDLIGL